MDEKDLNKAFAMVESHDVKVSTVRLTGSKEDQKRTLRDLKNWKKVSKSDGDTEPVCTCLDSWNTVCPVHG
jgi:DNA gyrase inhibitor GyrI